MYIYGITSKSTKANNRKGKTLSKRQIFDKLHDLTMQVTSTKRFCLQ